jgi:hypothetical protein
MPAPERSRSSLTMLAVISMGIPRICLRDCVGRALQNFNGVIPANAGIQ